MLLLLLICTAGAWHHYNEPIRQPTPHPVIIVNPEPQPIVEPPLPKNQETAPKEEPKQELVVKPKLDKAPIRYDKNVERPGGYYDYCDKYPTKPECGGKK